MRWEMRVESLILRKTLGELASYMGIHRDRYSSGKLGVRLVSLNLWYKTDLSATSFILCQKIMSLDFERWYQVPTAWHSIERLNIFTIRLTVTYIPKWKSNSSPPSPYSPWHNQILNKPPTLFAPHHTPQPIPQQDYPELLPPFDKLQRNKSAQPEPQISPDIIRKKKKEEKETTTNLPIIFPTSPAPSLLPGFVNAKSGCAEGS